MRSLFGLLAGAALFLLVSCTANLQETIIPHVGDVIELTAYADNGVATKTGIVDNGNGGKNVVWKSGNAISLFFNSGDNGGNKFTTTDSGPVATFKGSISAISGSLEEAGGKAYFWGLYPYNASASCDGTYITTTLPSSQLAYQGDVADDLLITVGRSENLAMSFKNACAVIGFTLSQDNISKVTFQGNNNEKVAGEFKASFDGNKLSVTPTSNAVKSIDITPAESSTFVKGKTYYFAILPGSFTKGYTLIFTRNDDWTAKYKRESAFTFEISKFYTMTNKDSGLSFLSSSPQDNEIWYKTSDGSKITIKSYARFGSNLVSNIYEDGQGRLIFDGPVTTLARSFDDGYPAIYLTEVIIPTTVETFVYPFDCSKLRSIQGKYASADGHYLIKDGTLITYANPLATSLSIPDNVVAIASGAFMGHSFENAVIPETIKFIDDNALDFSATNVTMMHYPNLGCNLPDCDSLTITKYIYDDAFAIYYDEYEYYNIPCDIGDFGNLNKSISIKLYDDYERRSGLPTSDYGQLPLDCKIYGKYASKDHRCWIHGGILDLFSGPTNYTYRLPVSITVINAGFLPGGTIIIPPSVEYIYETSFLQGTVYFESSTPPRLYDSLVDIGYLYVPERYESVYLESWSNILQQTDFHPPFTLYTYSQSDLTSLLQSTIQGK